jgi:starch-binding outer membrane protein, SusD/RagB family
MKKASIFFITTAAVLITGCGKYLEKEPDNRAKLTDPKKVSQLLASAYPLANYMAFTEAMSDNADDKGQGQVEPTNQSPYLFENVQTTDQDSPDNYWNECYKAIAAANEGLAACDKAANPDEYKKQRGEALIARAYAHYMLVTLYAKPYDVATAGTNPGVPYVTEPETVVIKQYERHTVAYVYDMIEKDLLAGLPLIDDAAYDKVKYHFNRSASNAFAARFYLSKRDYAKVVQYATASVPNFLPNLRPWNTTYQTYGINNLPAQYQRTSEAANLLLVSCPTLYNYGLSYVVYRYALSNDKMDEILDNSISVTGGSWSFILGYVGSQSNPAIPKLNYTDFVYETPTSNFGVGYGVISLFTTEEVLFNKAEANTYLGNYDAAINDLNIYMSTRITGATPGALAPARQITEAKVLAHYNGTLPIKEALVAYILELKRAEYIHEGMRWFDMLRYNIPVKHDINNGGTTGTSITIDANDKRRQLKLPDGVKLSGITDLNR